MYGRCRKIIILVALSLCLWGENPSEDEMIFRALDALDKADYGRAFVIYENLYNKTQKLEYLQELALLSAQLGRIDESVAYALKYRENGGKNLRISRLLVNNYINLKRFDEALKIQEEILNGENEDYIDIRTSANLYLIKRDFANARKYFLKAYEEINDERNLLSIVFIDIEEGYFERSIELIRAHFKDEMSEDFVVLTAGIAKRAGVLYKVEALAEEFYERKASERNILNLTQTLILGDKIPRAIEILEKNGAENDLLLDLYIMQKSYPKARNLTQNLFQKTQNDSYLGVLAMIDFEEADDKRAVLKSVIENFKKALKAEENHIFYNYLGYLLIDFEVDFDDGIKYVKKALSAEPNNPAYLDSLAWGYYKKDDCVNAKREIEKIPYDVIQKEEEILTHFEAINQCLKP